MSLFLIDVFICAAATKVLPVRPQQWISRRLHAICSVSPIQLWSSLSVSKVYLHEANVDLSEAKANLQHPDLPQRDLFDDGIVFGLNELLDGHDVARVSVPALEHNTVGSLSDLPDLLVLLHLRGSLRWADGHPEGKNRWMGRSDGGNVGHLINT